MRRIIFILIYFMPFFNLSPIFAQVGEWTWMNGTNTVNDSGHFGTMGVPSPFNTPPALYEVCDWVDLNGNFWLFGGLDSIIERNDLWKYDPVAHEWIWMKGSGNAGIDATYGVQGVPSPLNNPGGRAWGACSFVDSLNNLWMYGGIGYDRVGNFSCLNDLWKYDISTNEWTWMQGSDSGTIAAVFGTKGIASPANTPGARAESDASWTDKSNNLWLFGGAIYYPDSNGWGLIGAGNDLWKYDMGTNEWTWMHGDSLVDQPGNYGVMGVADANNVPGGRGTYTKWIDDAGDFWMFSGYDFYSVMFNDVWKYHIATNMWTWMSGTNLINDTGAANGKCNSGIIYDPGARYENRASTIDACGNFWTMGGFGSSTGTYNDLWKLDPVNLQWTWVSGDNTGNSVPVYGTKGVSSPLNIPDGKAGGGGWMDKSGNYWVFGGANTTWMPTNDMWRYVPDPSCSACSIVLPVAAFQSSDSTICSNDCIDYTDLSKNATSWQWSFQGGSPAVSTIQNPHSICYLASGNYDVTLIAFNNGWSDTLSFSSFINVIAASPTPTITQLHDTLICSYDSTYTSYQWYDNTSLVPGATNSSFIASHDGNYNVKVTNKEGCSIAVGINVVINGVQLLAHGQGFNFLLSPVPAKDKLIIENGSRDAGALQFTVYNVLGEKVLNNFFAFGEGRGEAIDVSALSSGIYFIRLVNENDKWIGRFVKQ